MQLLISEIDAWIEPEKLGEVEVGEIHVRVLRHWITFPDGRIYFQDEYLRRFNPKRIDSIRSPWNQLMTPPMVPTVAGVTAYSGLPCAITTDGKAYVWAATPPSNPEEERMLALAQQEHLIHQWPHSWVPFHDAVPGTPAHITEQLTRP